MIAAWRQGKSGTTTTIKDVAEVGISPTNAARLAGDKRRRRSGWCVSFQAFGDKIPKNMKASKQT